MQLTVFKKKSQILKKNMIREKQICFGRGCPLIRYIDFIFRIIVQKLIIKKYYADENRIVVHTRQSLSHDIYVIIVYINIKNTSYPPQIIIYHWHPLYTHMTKPYN